MAVAWGSDTAATQLTTVTVEQFFDTIPQIDPNEYVHVQVIANSSGTTDNIVIAVYATLDAAAENYDTVPIHEFELDCTDGADNDVSFIVRDVYKFRVGVRRNGSTDSFTVDMNSREATMS